MSLGRQTSKPTNSDASPGLSMKKRSPPQTNSREDSKSKEGDSNDLNTEDSIFEKVDSNSQIPVNDGSKTPNAPATARRGSNMTYAKNKRSTLSKNTTPNQQPLDNQENSMLIDEREEDPKRQKKEKGDDDGRGSSMESSMSRQSRMRVQRVTPKSKSSGRSKVNKQSTLDKIGNKLKEIHDDITSNKS